MPSPFNGEPMQPEDLLCDKCYREGADCICEAPLPPAARQIVNVASAVYVALEAGASKSWIARTVAECLDLPNEDAA